MLKNLSIAAIAMASVCAMAQETTTWSNDRTNWNREIIDDNMDAADKRMAVVKRARQTLSGGDAYIFTGLLDRSPTSVEMALVRGLFGAHRSAVMIREQMIMSRYPTYQSQYVTRGTDGTITTTTTTTWSNDEMAWRPMRMVMESNSMPRDINYLSAISILTQDLNDTQAGVLADWWARDASIREKDVVVRLLKNSAGYADHVWYPSVYSRRTW